MNFYEKNLEALFKRDRFLAEHISSIKTNERFDVFQGDDPLNINILDKENSDFIYEKPLNDVSEKLNLFNTKYPRYPVLFLYGVGNGILVKALLNNNAIKHLIIIEPSLELLYVALNLVDIADDISKERVILKVADGINFSQMSQLVTKKDIAPYVKVYDLHIQSEYYEKNFKDNINKINAIILKAYRHLVLGKGNDATDALIGVQHHIANMPQMLKNYKIKDLFKQKISDMAIVVSTGPSLTKQLPLLKEFAPYVTIISVDASLPILQKHNIIPDIVTSIERVVQTASFFDDISDEVAKHTYFVASSIIEPYTFYKLKDKKLVLSMRPFGYMLYYGFDDFGYLGSGMSAANLAYQLAAFMQYKKIVLIGQDLAYSNDGISHADGHKFIKGKDKHKETDTYVEAYGGDGFVKTTIQWDMFKNFFDKDITEAKECCSIETYNSTEGGARIESAIERPFKEV
ncbi:MAG: motility associated factor glycosyltransferase family protein [Campylobacterales bacterium]|nr:motility associated factor glycosyltransferase family protein [Campylobacterales bacterium]